MTALLAARQLFMVKQRRTSWPHTLHADIQLCCITTVSGSDPATTMVAYLEFCVPAVSSCGQHPPEQAPLAPALAPPLPGHPQLRQLALLPLLCKVRALFGSALRVGVPRAQAAPQQGTHAPRDANRDARPSAAHAVHACAPCA